jgi:uncharacterized protein
MGDAQDLEVTERTRHSRQRENGSVSAADLRDVLAAGFVCHLAFIRDGVPVALPTAYGLDWDAQLLYLHGSVASRSLVEAPAQTVSVTVTHVDGLVLARSVFEHSVSYRSAMLFGVPRAVVAEDELRHGLRVLSEHIAPGQWDYVRQPSRKELAATTLLTLGLDEASVKISAGHTDDAASPDGRLPVWAGLLPLLHLWGTPEPDPALRDGIALPEHLARRAGDPAHPPGSPQER